MLNKEKKGNPWLPFNPSLIGAKSREGVKGETVGFPLFVLLALVLLDTLLNIAEFALLGKVSRFL